MSRKPSIEADLTRRCVSRRRPKLKVVGSARSHIRHATYFLRGSEPVAVEFWSYAEWDATPAWERPEIASSVPGIGFATMFHPEPDDLEDIRDSIAQVRQPTE